MRLLFSEKSYQALTVISRREYEKRLFIAYRIYEIERRIESKAKNEMRKKKKAEEISRMQLLLYHKRKLIFSLKKRT